jgi:hypothetical protein
MGVKNFKIGEPIIFGAATVAVLSAVLPSDGRAICGHAAERLCESRVPRGLLYAPPFTPFSANSVTAVSTAFPTVSATL